MSALNPAQTAALQQMGICVWQSADTVEAPAAITPTESSAPSSSSGSVNQAVVKATSEERRASGAKMLAQLRSSLGTDTPEKTPEAAASASPKTAAKSDTPSPVTQPLTAEQQQRFAQLIEDIQQAASIYTTAEQAISVMHGDTLQVSRETVVLPGGPEALTPQLKQQLWRALAKLA